MFGLYDLIGEVAKLFADAGVICIASAISPYRKDRDACRSIFPEGDFIEVGFYTYSCIVYLNLLQWLIRLVIDRYSWIYLYLYARPGIQKAYTSLHAPERLKVYYKMCLQLLSL